VTKVEVGLPSGKGHNDNFDLSYIGQGIPSCYNLINKVTIITVYNTTLTIILNNLQQHVSAIKSHLQAEYKAAYIIKYHKMDEISFTEFFFLIYLEDIIKIK
jgi:hypothetical protein